MNAQDDVPPDALLPADWDKEEDAPGDDAEGEEDRAEDADDAKEEWAEDSPAALETPPVPPTPPSPPVVPGPPPGPPIRQICWHSPWVIKPPGTCEHMPLLQT